MGGYPFDKPWARTIECIHAMKKLWTEEKASFQDEYVSFPEVYCYPKPLQQPHPPILWGAGNPNTKAMPTILKRTAELADGMDASRKNTAELVAEYEQVGVHRILVGFSDLKTDTAIRELEHAARALKLTGV